MKRERFPEVEMFALQVLIFSGIMSLYFGVRVIISLLSR